MFQMLRKQLEKAEGFTLIELVVVIAILGLLVALALPNFLGARSRAALAEARQFADEWKSLTYGCWLEKNQKATKCNTASEVGWDPPDTAYWEFTGATITCNGGACVDGSTVMEFVVDGVAGSLVDGGTYEMQLTFATGAAEDFYTPP